MKHVRKFESFRIQKNREEIIRESVESIRSNWTPHIRYQRSLGKDSCTDIGECICRNPIQKLNV